MPPFSILHPHGNPNSLVFNSPHSGTYFPKDALSQVAVDPALLHYSSDMYVDQLIKKTPYFGATVFHNHYARTYVDTNRSPLEIDPDMFNAPLGNIPFKITDKVNHGFGIFSRRIYNGLEIYYHRLHISEISERLNKIYHPIHNELNSIIDQLYQKHGFTLFIDCHSMPSYNFIDPKLSNDSQADVIIGNCFNQSCGEIITEYIAKFFTKRGMKVAFNKPYSGGFNTQNYGIVSANKHALQLEFSRALYMNEETLTISKGLTKLQNIITALSEDLAKNLSRLLAAEK